MNYLEINTLVNSIPIGKLQKLSTSDQENFPDSFTYFDCTNYRDHKYKKVSDHQHKQVIENLTDGETQLLCYRLDRFPAYFSFLNAFVYARLLLDWGVRKVIDVHGGYFEGEFTRSAIYKLAFTGLRGLLLSFKPEVEAGTQKSEQLHYQRYEALFNSLSDKCFEKQIQVAFSPNHFDSEVLGVETLKS